MTGKCWLPKPHEYREYDGGRLILRRLGPGRYVGLLLPQFTSLRGKSVDAVMRKYDSRTDGLARREHAEHTKRPRKGELRMAREFLTRPWV